MVAIVGACIFDKSGVDPADLGRPSRDARRDVSALLDRAALDVVAPDRAASDLRPDRVRDGKLPRDGKPGDAAPKKDGAHLDSVVKKDAKPVDTLAKKDAKPVDLTVKADAKVYRPVSAQEILTEWWATLVPCVNQYGQAQGYNVGIIDSNLCTMVNGTVTLAAAPASTKAWVGTLPSVTIVWDLAACAYEDPAAGDNEWASAGLLIRGATINAQGKLVLQPGVTVQDMDLIDVYSTGGFEGSIDFVLPTDAELHLHPQLVNTVNAAKAAIIKVASN